MNIVTYFHTLLIRGARDGTISGVSITNCTEYIRDDGGTEFAKESEPIPVGFGSPELQAVLGTINVQAITAIQQKDGQIAELTAERDQALQGKAAAEAACAALQSRLDALAEKA